MLNHYYLIAGPFVDDEALFWSNSQGWVSLPGATRFERDILVKRLPLEGVGVWEFDESGSPVQLYECGSHQKHPGWWQGVLK